VVKSDINFRDLFQMISTLTEALNGYVDGCSGSVLILLGQTIEQKLRSSVPFVKLQLLTFRNFSKFASKLGKIVRRQVLSNFS